MKAVHFAIVVYFSLFHNGLAQESREGATCGEPFAISLPKTTFPLTRNHHYTD